MIIATASVVQVGLVSNEGRQNQLPDVMAKCKIPVTCDLEPVGVRCIDFITLIKESGEVFEGAGK